MVLDMYTITLYNATMKAIRDSLYTTDQKFRAKRIRQFNKFNLATKHKIYKMEFEITAMEIKERLRNSIRDDIDNRDGIV
jgi:hypothetical protein